MAQLFLTTIIFICSLLHSDAFPSLTVGAVDHHILFPDQELVIGQTLVSRNQVFEMGFFSPGKSVNKFLGIWYKSTSDVVVWVANRNNPISHSQAPVFMISRNGNLVISSGKSIIWCMNSTKVATNPVLQLLDSGNLVLEDNNTTHIWQSFDYPSDTLLPGMKMVDDAEAGVERYLTSWRNPDDPSPGDFVIKIQNHGLSEIVILTGATTRYRHGQWNGIYFWGGVKFPNSIYKPEMVFREERLISIVEPYNQSSLLARITIDSTGRTERHHMNAQNDKWNVASTFPRDTCDEYASCGPNGICRTEKPIRCQCLNGFVPKFKKDWELQDWSGGCERITPLNCYGGDGFLQIRGVRYPDLLSFWVNSSINLEECRDKCLKNCSCTAYANPFITNGGSGCLLWFAELMDTKALSDADSKQNIYIRIPLSELGNSFHNCDKVGNNCASNKQFLRGKHDWNWRFRSCVHKQGKMLSGEEIAVKRLSRSSRQGLEEFRNEIMLIVADQNRRMLLTWAERYEIIMGISRGLLYLHHDSRLKIIHRDVAGYSLRQAWMLWQEEKILELMDESLKDTFVESEVKICMQVGLLCVQKFAEDRPIMSSVVSMLRYDGAVVLPEPKEPGFFIHYQQSGAAPSSRTENEVTITDLEAR